MTNPLDEVRNKINSVYERLGGDMTDDDFRALITYHRSERAMWVDKQEKKGKQE